MRMNVTAAALAAVSAAACGPALAQPFIEIEWEGTGRYDPFQPELLELFGGRAVFDAAASPISSDSSFIGFEAVEAEWYSVTPSGEPETQYAPEDAFLYYRPPTGSLTVLVDVDLGVSLSFSQTTSAFMVGMDSLPDDPASYAFTGGSGDLVTASGRQGGAIWSPGSGFNNGIFRYWIREVENPNPPEPCFADLDGNGILDLTDVNLFINGFVAGCP